MTTIEVHKAHTIRERTVTLHQVVCECGWVSREWGELDDMAAEFGDHRRNACVIIPLFRHP